MILLNRAKDMFPDFVHLKEPNANTQSRYPANLVNGGLQAR
jgi:hypothetical protein